MFRRGEESVEVAGDEEGFLTLCGDVERGFGEGLEGAEERGEEDGRGCRELKASGARGWVENRSHVELNLGLLTKPAGQSVQDQLTWVRKGRKRAHRCRLLCRS